MKLILALILSFFSLESGFAAFINVRGIESSFFHRVYISPFEDNLIYAAGNNTLFKSSNKGKLWQKVFIAKAEELKDIFVDEYLYDTVYLASQSYLYRVVENKVEKIFSLPPDVESICIKSHKGIVYLGTNQGLYYSSDDFWNWKKMKGLPEDSIVYSLDFSLGNIFAATDRGVYKATSRNDFRRIFVLKKVDSEEEEEDEDDFFPSVLKVDEFNPKTVYLGTSKGLFASYNEGAAFSKAYISIIENAGIRCISQISSDKQALYLATDKGIFRINLEEKTYRSLFEGLPTKDIFWVDFAKAGILFAATDKGLFFKEEFTIPASYSKLEELLEREPSFSEVQEAALRYNEVHPGKIAKWRKALKVRAVFPEVSLDYDKTIYGAYGASYRGAIVGPRDWGINLKWDIGDLIWNSYEDDIDTRSRLVTQLRVNILDDINAVYFERLRVKLESINKTLNEDEKLRKQLRLRELTAALDAYTGGYFSERLRELRGCNESK